MQLFPLKYKVTPAVCRVTVFLIHINQEEKGVFDTSCRRRRLIFPWRLRKGLWLGYILIHEPICSKDIRMPWFLWANKAHSWEGLDHTQHQNWAQGREIPPRKSEKWEMMLRSNNSMSSTFFSFFPCFSFSPSFLLSSMANSVLRVEATNMRTYFLPLRPFRAH